MALRSGLSVITGGPGTGKTYTAARLLALLLALDPHPERLQVAVAAPTGKAAARLKQSIGGALQELQAKVAQDLPLESLVRAIGPARTLHSLLGARPDTRKFRYDAANPLEVDVLIVDEASMIHLEMMAALLEALPPQEPAGPAWRQGSAGLGGGGRRAGRVVPRCGASAGIARRRLRSSDPSAASSFPWSFWPKGRRWRSRR